MKKKIEPMEYLGAVTLVSVHACARSKECCCILGKRDKTRLWRDLRGNLVMLCIECSELQLALAPLTAAGLLK